jgi:hypothetical protein
LAGRGGGDARVAEMDAEVVAAAIVEDAVRSALEK